MDDKRQCVQGGVCLAWCPGRIILPQSWCVSIATFYVRGAGGNQAVTAYISTGVAFVSFVGTLLFHVYLQKKQKFDRYWKVVRQYLGRRQDAENPEESRPLLN